ncbi:MAG: hypothetical protein BWK76_04220 [Desulfobulbaceae bacterium A2]|nr:MAG: hypothetical protein BWK76_04220 [Desulfobulbaceae bacterium A2]
MTEVDLTLISELRRVLADAVAGHIVAEPLKTDGADPALCALAEAFGRLLVNLEAMQRFAVALANGEITTEAQPRNVLLGPLKSLQASLRHLTWQTQEVAAGHLEHRVDFLGEFSVAFNQMIDALRMKRRAEHEAMEATRLAGIGQLAAGIAHEINTPLQYIDANLDFVQAGLLEWQGFREAARSLAARACDTSGLAEETAQLRQRDDELAVSSSLEEMRGALGDVLSGTRRIGKIVTAVKNFTAIGGSSKTLTDINQVIEDTVEVSRNAWSSVAECLLDLSPSLPRVLCRAEDIHQALLNLILNAAQAIEECGMTLPGRITVNSRRVADHVLFSVADNGPGIPEANRKQIFNLFYTTRDVGKGTGLGLALVYDVIVTKHGGTIEVGGEEGEGAMFTLGLPLA